MTRVEKIYIDKRLRRIFAEHIIAGVGWGIGATIGVSLILLLASGVLNMLGGLPLVGDFFAQLIDVTNDALKTRGIK